MSLSVCVLFISVVLVSKYLLFFSATTKTVVSVKYQKWLEYHIRYVLLTAGTHTTMSVKSCVC